MIFFVFEQAYSIATCVRQGDISALSFQCAKDVVFFFFHLIMKLLIFWWGEKDQTQPMFQVFFWVF